VSQKGDALHDNKWLTSFGEDKNETKHEQRFKDFGERVERVVGGERRELNSDSLADFRKRKLWLSGFARTISNDNTKDGREPTKESENDGSEARDKPFS